VTTAELAPFSTPFTIPKVLPKGSFGEGMMVSTSLPRTFWQSAARASIPVPSAARYNATAMVAFLFIRSFPLGSDLAIKFRGRETGKQYLVGVNIYVGQVSTSPGEVSQRHSQAAGPCLIGPSCVAVQLEAVPHSGGVKFGGISFEGATLDVQYICRRARREDIQNSVSLWAKDRVLYDADVWTSLPALLEDLMQRELVSFAFIESLPGRAPQLFGGISFIRPEYLKQARSGPATLPNCVMQAALRNRNPFLSPREVGEENARGELHLLPLFGNMDAINLAEPDVANFYRTSNEGFRFFVFGYSLRAMWMEVFPPHHIEELKQQGMLIDRQLPLAGGRTATLLRLTREEALANPYARFCTYFFPPKPHFAFSFGEQRLLEYALLGVSDQATAEELHLSEDAIKKRWRSIYARIETADTKLLSDITSAAGRRRSVLHYLRGHLEELRPYRERRTSQ
jgi:hypothetical protein